MTSAAPAKAVAPAAKPSLDQRREERARPSLRAFAILLPQIVALAALTDYFHSTFARAAWAVVAGFVVHFWLPYRWKEPFWILLSIAGGVYLAAPDGSLLGGARIMALVLGVGLLIWAIVATPLPWSARAILVAAVFGGVIYCGTLGRASVRAPDRFYTVFGMAFMFRIFPYLYEARLFKTRASLREFLRYFFMLPQYKWNGPIFDFQRLGQSVYQREIQKVAQQGIFWIARGMSQFAVYLLMHKRIYYAQSASDERSPRMLAVHLVCAYAIYLRTSGIIHVFLGMMKLFGYDLTEGYKWYAFARSPLDFWRRANIYWKDIMMKVVYFPVYFALRKKTESGGKMIALFVVFTASWALHIWQASWFSDMRVSPWRAVLQWPQEALFWGIFAMVCAVNLALEIRAESAPKAPVPRAAPRAPAPKPTGVAALVAMAREHVIERLSLPRGVHPLRVAVQTAATWLMIACLFSLEHAPSIRSWTLTMKFWN